MNVCVLCGKPNESGFKRCDACREERRKCWNEWRKREGSQDRLTEYSRRRREKRKREGRCALCGTPLESKRWVHCDVCRKKVNERSNKWYHGRKLGVFKHYSNNEKPSCDCCGESEIKFLCLDHIGGGGSAHRRELNGNGRAIYGWIIKNNFPDGFRVLCANCNQAYGYYGTCPHQENKI